MRNDTFAPYMWLSACVFTAAAAISACSMAEPSSDNNLDGTPAAATTEATDMDAQAQTSIEAASRELEAASQEIRAMISHEFPDAQWKAPENTEQGFASSVCDNPVTTAAYTAQLWQLPVELTDRQLSELAEGFVEIAARYGYTTTEQSRSMGEAKFLDLAGPYPGATIGLAYKKALVITGSLGCMPRESGR